MKKCNDRFYVGCSIFLYKPNKGGKEMKRLCLSIVPLLLLAFTLPGLAQTVTGAVRGTITDATGAIVPGADVTATNVATGVKTSTKTNQAGEYSIRFLQIGSYKLAIAANGFDTA